MKYFDGKIEIIFFNYEKKKKNVQTRDLGLALGQLARGGLARVLHFDIKMDSGTRIKSTI